jgi:hypothetical protein
MGLPHASHGRLKFTLSIEIYFWLGLQIKKQLNQRVMLTVESRAKVKDTRPAREKAGYDYYEY